jgi:hypothetical protein
LKKTPRREISKLSWLDLKTPSTILKNTLTRLSKTEGFGYGGKGKKWGSEGSVVGVITQDYKSYVAKYFIFGVP